MISLIRLMCPIDFGTVEIFFTNTYSHIKIEIINILLYDEKMLEFYV